MKICAVQLNLKNCKDFRQFYFYLENIFEQAQDCDLLVFPENINFCLLLYQAQPITLSIKTQIEKLFDSFISKLNLSFIFKKQDLNEQKEVILSCYSILAAKYKTNVITGSFYEQKDDGIYNSIYAIDRNGKILENASKKDLVGLEKALKIKSEQLNKVVNFDFGRVGLSVCFDLNDKDYISQYKCDVLVAPSNGWRLFPGYPFDSKTETPQIERAKENNFAIIRPYCAGWLGPLYFAGRSMIVDRMGNIINKSKTRNQTELLISDIDI
jgi:predicted amidohydrolase